MLCRSSWNLEAAAFSPFFSNTFFRLATNPRNANNRIRLPEVRSGEARRQTTCSARALVDLSRVPCFRGSLGQSRRPFADISGEHISKQLKRHTTLRWMYSVGSIHENIITCTSVVAEQSLIASSCKLRKGHVRIDGHGVLVVIAYKCRFGRAVLRSDSLGNSD